MIFPFCKLKFVLLPNHNIAYFVFRSFWWYKMLTYPLHFSRKWVGGKYFNSGIHKDLLSYTNVNCKCNEYAICFHFIKHLKLKISYCPRRSPIVILSWFLVQRNTKGHNFCIPVNGQGQKFAFLQMRLNGQNDVI